MENYEKKGIFDELLSFGEAAEIWEVDSSALRKAVADRRLKEGKDCRKFGKQWVVTVDAMMRLYGKQFGSRVWNAYLDKKAI